VSLFLQCFYWILELLRHRGIFVFFILFQNIYTFIATPPTWTSEWFLSNAKWACFSYIMARKSYIQWNDDDVVRFLLDQHAKCDCYTSLKQQSAGRHVVPLGHIISIPTPAAFALIRNCYVLDGEAIKANIIVNRIDHLMLGWGALDCGFKYRGSDIFTVV